MKLYTVCLLIKNNTLYICVYIIYKVIVSAIFVTSRCSSICGISKKKKCSAFPIFGESFQKYKKYYNHNERKQKGGKTFSPTVTPVPRCELKMNKQRWYGKVSTIETSAR